MDRECAESLYKRGMEPTVQKLLELDAQVDSLNARIARLSTNSANSSKPPSSDIVKKNCAQKKRNKKKRKKGGQLNHPRWQREPFDPLAPDVKRIEYTMTHCPNCNTPLQPKPQVPPRILEQVEVANLIEKTEHKAGALWCPKCKCFHYPRFPEPVLNQCLFKTHLSTIVCFLKYAGAMSLSGIKKYLRDSVGVDVTKGYLSKVIAKGSKAVEPSYNELFALLPYQEKMNVDETGHKENGNKLWTWLFRTSVFALFKIDQSRGSDVLVNVLGKEFNGVLGCDYFSAYRKYMREFGVQLQFCLAHLIRDVKFLVEYPHQEVQRYGTRLLDHIRDLFHIIHRKDQMSESAFLASLEEKRQAIILAATTDAPCEKVAQNMKLRFEKHGKEYFTFITTPGMDPTNNCAEQAIRFVVQYRHMSQGTRSEKGRVACERFWTVIATCAIQGRSAFDFIKDSFEAYFNNSPPPSLIPVKDSS